MTSPATSFNAPSRAALFRRYLVSLSWVLLLGFATSSCGKRGDPLPPFRRVPAAAVGFQLRQSGEQFVLSWTSPDQNTDGTIEDVSLVEVEIHRRVVDYETIFEETLFDATSLALERAVRDAEREALEPEIEPGETRESDTADENLLEPSERAAPVGENAPDSVSAEPAISGDPEADTRQSEPDGVLTDESGEELSAEEADVAEELVEQEPLPTPVAAPDFLLESELVETLPSTELSAKLSWEEPIDPEWEGMRVEYAIRYVNRKNRPGPFTAVLQIAPAEAPDRPSAPSLEVTEQTLLVRWDPSLSEPPEEMESGIQLYRRSGEDEAYPDQPLHPGLLAQPPYRDLQTQFGTEYCYIARQVLKPVVEVEPVVDPLSSSAEAVLDEAGELAGSELVPALDDPSQPSETEIADLMERLDELSAEPDAQALPAEPELSPEEMAELAAAEARAAAPLTQEDLPEGLELPEGVELTYGELDELIPEFIIPPIANPFLYESLPSEEVCVLPEDTFAPDRVRDLVAVAANQSVLLSWSDLDIADLAGYHVYRSKDRPGDFERLTAEPISRATYRDDNPGSAVFFYYVAGVDTSPAANEGERSNIVQAQLEDGR